MRESRFRLGDRVAIGDEAEAVEGVGVGVDGWIFHHGTLGDGDPVLSWDVGAVGEGVWGQSASEDRYFKDINTCMRELSLVLLGGGCVQGQDSRESRGFVRADSLRKLSSRGRSSSSFHFSSARLAISCRSGSMYSGYRHRLCIANVSD